MKSSTVACRLLIKKAWMLTAPPHSKSIPFTIEKDDNGEEDKNKEEENGHEDDDRQTDRDENKTIGVKRCVKFTLKDTAIVSMQRLQSAACSSVFKTLRMRQNVTRTCAHSCLLCVEMCDYYCVVFVPYLPPYFQNIS